MTRLAICISACLFSACLFAEQLIVQRADLWSENRTAPGKLVIRGDQMTFVDDNNPDNSFIISKQDVRGARWEGGRLTIQLANPYHGAFGDQRELVLVMPDQTAPGSVITWVGVPVAGFENEADRGRSGPMSNMNISDVRFDVRNGDQRGKLIFQDDQLLFESLSDARHSQRWRYSDIRSVNRDGHNLKIRPFKGDEYKFQFSNKAMQETVYSMISDRVVAAREGR